MKNKLSRKILLYCSGIFLCTYILTMIAVCGYVPQLHFPPLSRILLIGVVLYALTALLGWRLTREVVQPLENLHAGYSRLNPEEISPELKPLLQTLHDKDRIIAQQRSKMTRWAQEFDGITGNMSEGFIITDNQAKVVSYNASALRLLNAKPDADGRWALSQAKPFGEVTSAALCGRRMEQLLEIDGRCCQFIANPIIQNGQVRGAVIIILDVTEKEQRERLRREFSANVSHELKTPLTAISGFAEIIRAGLTDTASTQEFAGDIYRESQRMIALINDIIRLSSLDEGELEEEKEPVDLRQIALEVQESLQSAAAHAQVVITVEGGPAEVLGVKQLIREMVLNLADNAIKYNNSGGRVTLRTSKTQNTAVISVADTGIGIPKAAQSRVFERFYRVDEGRSRSLGGTGLGLSIVKHAAARHQAEVSLVSEEGQGTTVTLTFPARP